MTLNVSFKVVSTIVEHIEDPSAVIDNEDEDEEFNYVVTSTVAVTVKECRSDIRKAIVDGIQMQGETVVENVLCTDLVHPSFVVRETYLLTPHQRVLTWG